MTNFLLKAIVFVPVFGSLLIPFSALISKQVRNLFSLLLGILTFCFSIMLIPAIYQNPISFEIAFPLGFNFILTADMLSVYMAAVSSFVSMIILLYSIDYISHYENQTEYYTMVVLFLGSMMGLVFSSNLIWMYTFWELTGFCSWRLVGFFRSDRDVLKANKTILVTVFGALVMLLGIIMVYFERGTLDMRIMRGENISFLAASLLLIGIFAKSATLPFSTWLPDAGVAPSTVTSLLHAAVLVKIGIYAYARIFGVTLIAPEAFKYMVLIITGLSAIISAGAAMVETDIKRIIAYSTVSQLAFIFLGLATGNKMAFAGGLLYILMHSLAKGGLFLCAGIIEQKTHNKDITKMGGLFSTMPITAIAFALCSFSVMGIPPFGGFFSKFIVLKGAVETGSGLIISLFLIGAIMTLLYLTRLFYMVFLGKYNGEHYLPKEGSFTMVFSVAILALSGIFFGFFVNYPYEYVVIISKTLGVNLQ